MTIGFSTTAKPFTIHSGDVFGRNDSAFIVSAITARDAFRIIYLGDGSGTEYSYPALRNLIETLGYKRYTIEHIVLKDA